MGEVSDDDIISELFSKFCLGNKFREIQITLTIFLTINLRTTII